MKTSVVKIGNSKVILVDQLILDKYGIKDKVELILEDDYLIIKPIKEVRIGWDVAFKKMAANNEDNLIINDVFENEHIVH